MLMILRRYDSSRHIGGWMAQEGDADTALGITKVDTMTKGSRDVVQGGGSIC